MNRAKNLMFSLVLLVLSMASDVDSRTIRLRESLNLAPGDTINAQTVIDSIKVASKGDFLIFHSLVVKGDFNIRHSGINNVWCNIRFSNAVFQGDVEFRDADFQGYAEFSGVDFQGNAYFNSAVFKRDANFGSNVFQGNAFFQSAVFQGYADFGHAVFQGYADFQSADFQGYASFRYADFQRYSDFREAVFHGKANFFNAVFKGVALFNTAKFQGDAGFLNSEFQNDVQFNRVIFQRALGFGKTEFKKIANFEEAEFQGDVYFGSVIYNLIFITWKQLDGHMWYDRTNYSTFLGNFDRLNLTDDYDACYYNFRVQKRKNELSKFNPFRWLERIFLDLTCGYGVKPFRAIVWAGSFMFIFAFFYTKNKAIELRVERKKCNGVKNIGVPCNNDRKYGSEFCPQHQNQATLFRRFKNALYFSIGTFTTVGYGDWHPVGKYRYFAMIEGLVGWLILALFLVTLGKVWIR